MPIICGCEFSLKLSGTLSRKGFPSVSSAFCSCQFVDVQRVTKGYKAGFPSTAIAQMPFIRPQTARRHNILNSISRAHRCVESKVESKTLAALPSLLAVSCSRRGNRVCVSQDFEKTNSLLSIVISELMEEPQWTSERNHIMWTTSSIWEL